ncbi:MAG: hypothetical protein H6978_13015 [Gammaproteobacteria bacterium]|nr:hypothetical protein [Gammaproteobacteria bacterium]
MSNLQLTLLIAGIVVVAGVYLWSVLNKRRRNRRRSQGKRRPRPSLRQPPEPALPDPEPFGLPDGDELGPVRIVSRTPATARQDEDFGELPAIRRDEEVAPLDVKPSRSRQRRDRQLELNLDEEEARASSPAPAVPASAPAPSASAPAPSASAPAPSATAPTGRPTSAVRPAVTREVDGVDTAAQASDLLIIYLRAAPGGSWDASELKAALELVDMRYGDMRIFHHYGVGTLASKVSLFSVANMFEPGHLDVEAMAGGTTSGLALFMPLPAPRDAGLVLELFINTAERLADLLEGDLLDASHKPLAAPAIEKMRSRAARFANVDS